MANLRGILLMVMAMAGFAASDVAIKLLTASWPLWQIMGMVGIGGTLVFALWTRATDGRVLVPALVHRAVAVRFVAEVAGALFMFSALALTPLSLVLSVIQAGPLVVTLGAAVFFGETVGWRRWLAILVGLLGVLVILRPGVEGFDAVALLSVGAMLSLATRDLATRAAPRALSTLQLATFGFSALIFTAALLAPISAPPVAPNLGTLALLTSAIITGVAGYYGITAAMRTGEISVVSPFRYTRLIFGLVLGVVIFGERLDLWILIGGAMVVGSGLYAVWRERRRAKAAAAARAPAASAPR